MKPMKTAFLTFSLLCSALCAACGPFEPVIQTLPRDLPVALADRCTVYTLTEGQECCDDDSLLCDGTLVVCQAHLWVTLTPEHCASIASDPRRPELATYGTLCDMTPAGTYAICGEQAPKL